MSSGISEIHTAGGLLAVREKIMWLSQTLKKEGNLGRELIPQSENLEPVSAPSTVADLLVDPQMLQFPAPSVMLDAVSCYKAHQ